VDELIPIGQFAALTGLSPKALRIYQDQGLLTPAEVDPDSGYRYYSVWQVDIAARIALLRRAGVTLGDIAAFLADPSTDRIEEWRLALDAEVAERRRMLDHIAQLTRLEETSAMTTTATNATLERAIPVLASLDLEATQHFYATRLGFDTLFTYPDYAISARDGVQVHFWLTDDPAAATITSCRVDVTGVDALYAEMQAADVVHPNGALREQPWGFKEFSVLDGDGNLITFGERI
jgi:DNA-binding transcriptional MerR regulator